MLQTGEVKDSVRQRHAGGGDIWVNHSLGGSTATARHVGTAKPPKTPMPKEHAQKIESTQQEIQEDRKLWWCGFFFFFLSKADLPKIKKICVNSYVLGVILQNGALTF